MGWLARFSHHLPVEARDRPVITSLRLPAVLTVLFKYTSARQGGPCLVLTALSRTSPRHVVRKAG